MQPSKALVTSYDDGDGEVACYQEEAQSRTASKLRLRHLRRGDRQRFKEFLARCSAAAIRFRFMCSIKAPSDSLLNHLVEADGYRQVALIVTQAQADDERIVGEGRYVVFNEHDDVAEIALLVTDQLQRRGIATLLIQHLIEIAGRKGVTRFIGDVLAGNRAMLSLLGKTAQGLSATMSGGVLHFEVPVYRNATAHLAKVYGSAAWLEVSSSICRSEVLGSQGSMS
jgi:GNAT superfamily N-acetyltransferase